MLQLHGVIGIQKHCKNGQEKTEKAGFKNQFVLLRTPEILYKKTKFEPICRLNLSNLPTKITKAKIYFLIYIISFYHLLDGHKTG